MDKAHWRLSRTPSVAVERPFDPAPLMQRLRGRTSSDRFRFAVFADTHHSPAFGEIMRLIERLEVDFVVAPGDLVDLGGGREGPVHYARLAEEAGDFLRALPVWPAVGNHDADSRWDNDVWNGHANFAAFYNLPPRYRFDFRNATFIVLSWMLPDAEEMAWLTAELADRPAEHVFVAAHCPLVNITGMDGVREAARPVARELKRLLARHGVAAHLSGHSHIYYRTVRDGVNYVISGGAGRGIADITRPQDALQADSFFGRDPHSGRYVLRAGGRERTLDGPRSFLVVIDIDGGEVAGRVVTADGDTWERFAIRPPP